MTQEKFEIKWLKKTVFYDGNGFWSIPKGDYIVTAALYNFSDNETVFSVRHNELGMWYTIHVRSDQLNVLDGFKVKDKDEVSKV